MGADEAQELRDMLTRHDVRLSVLEGNWEEQKATSKAILAELGRLSSYNIEVASGLRKSVYGNGQPGLISDMTHIKEAMQAMSQLIRDRKEVHDKEIGRVYSVLCWSGIAVFGILVSAIGYLIPALIKHMVGQ